MYRSFWYHVTFPINVRAPLTHCILHLHWAASLQVEARESRRVDEVIQLSSILYIARVRTYVHITCTDREISTRTTVLGVTHGVLGPKIGKLRCDFNRSFAPRTHFETRSVSGNSVQIDLVSRLVVSQLLRSRSSHTCLALQEVHCHHLGFYSTASPLVVIQHGGRRIEIPCR